MSLTKKIVHVVWLSVAIGLALMPGGSGDTNLLVGWVFFVWTFPFSGAWWFYLYDIALQYMSKPAAQAIGSALVIACAYAFWFLLIPWLWRKSRRSSTENRSQASI